MRQESNHRMSNSGKGSNEISNSRAMGVILLIALLFVFQVVTFIVHKIREKSYSGGDAEVEIASSPVRFRFNPNTITSDSLQLLGFTPKQAQSIMNYREKGGKFRKKGDFAKLYVVDSTTYASLEEYIFIPSASGGTGGKEITSGQRHKNPEVRENTSKVRREKTSVAGRQKNSERQEASSGKQKKVAGGENVKEKKRERLVCNLNTADSTELVKLYGIGGYYAKKILEYRERLGGSFVSVRQLLEIEGFTLERFSKIEKNITVHKDEVKGFSILGADKRALERHPYIGKYAARGILLYIELKGKDSFSDELQLLDELVKERVLDESDAIRLREYLLHL